MLGKKKNKQKKQKTLLALIVAGFMMVVFLITTGFGCQEETTDPSKLPEVELEFWGLWETREDFEGIIEAYEALRPNVTVNYRKMVVESYEDEVLSGLASGRGPDLWMIHNTWLPRHKDKLVPLGEDKMSVRDYLDSFVDVTAEDFISDENIYGIALSVDTLALYYNRDLLNAASIPEAPRTWDEFNEAIKSLTRFDNLGEIEQSGAAMGTSQNVNRAVDILCLLMMQNGAQMVDDQKTRATFNQKIESGGETYLPGLDALKYYTNFANPGLAVYTWNPTLPYSVDSFLEERVAMMFNYSYMMDTLDSKAPKLKYDVSSMPQIKGVEGTSRKIDYANYWATVVSANSTEVDYAWDFLMYMGRKESVEKYTAATGRPASRRDVLTEQLKDPKLKIFAEQALTARSWYQVDPSAIEGIFSNMIESVVLGEGDADELLDSAAKRVTLLMQE